MKTFAIQTDIAWEDKPTNFARVRDGSPGRSARRVAGDPAGAVRRRIQHGRRQDCRRRQRPDARLPGRAGGGSQLYRVGGRRDACARRRGRNEAVAFGPDGSETARYCKLHPFSYAGETDHYAPGAEVVTFDWEGITVAPLICYDLRFPEAFRAAVRKGAELYAVIANWPEPREQHWAALLDARAIENQAYVLGVNRVGSDPNTAYAGRSRIIDPRGRSSPTPAATKPSSRPTSTSTRCIDTETNSPHCGTCGSRLLAEGPKPGPRTGHPQRGATEVDSSSTNPPCGVPLV